MKYYAVVAKKETGAYVLLQKDSSNTLLSENIWNVLCIMGYNLYKEQGRYKHVNEQRQV